MPKNLKKIHNSLTLGVSRVKNILKENLWMDKFCSLGSLTKKKRNIKSFLCRSSWGVKMTTKSGVKMT